MDPGSSNHLFGSSSSSGGSANAEPPCPTGHRDGPSEGSTPSPSANPDLCQSIALAEFASLLHQGNSVQNVKEHILHLVQETSSYPLLVRVARTLEGEGRGHKDRLPHGDTTPPSTSDPQSLSHSPTTLTTVSASTTSRNAPMAAGGSQRRHRRSSAMFFDEYSSLPGFDASHLTSQSDLSGNSFMEGGGGGALLPGYGIQRKASGSSSRGQTSRMSTMTQEPLEANRRRGCDRSSSPRAPAALYYTGRRAAVSAAPCAMSDLQRSARRCVPKSTTEELHMQRAVRACHLFSELGDEDISEIVQAMEKEVHAAGTAILEQGKEPHARMYLLAEGTCEAVKNGKSVGTMQAGSTFGDMELMYQQDTCAATIRCITRCVVYTLDEESYHRAILTRAMQKRNRFESVTQQVAFLRCLPDYERMKVAEALSTRTFYQGDYLINFGRKGTHLHFIMEGEVRVIGRNQGKCVEVVHLYAGDVVGELEFLFGHLTVADVMAVSARVVTAFISRQHFQLIAGPIKERLTEFIATSNTYENYYLSEVANASVRSEISRSSQQTPRRTASGQVRTKQREQPPTHRSSSPGTAKAAPSRKPGEGGQASEAETGDGATAGATTVRVATVGSHGLGDIDAKGEVVLPIPSAVLSAGLVSPVATIPASQRERDGRTRNLGETEDWSTSSAVTVCRFSLSPLCSAGMAMMGLREDGLIVSWNDVLERLTSYPAEEVIGQSIYSFLLDEKEQAIMYGAVTAARRHAGRADAFMQHMTGRKSSRNVLTLARSDGLTKAAVALVVIPPTVSAGEEAPEVLLAIGEEVKQTPHQVNDQSQWLSGQLKEILADPSQTYEGRLMLIAETLENYETMYRAMTVSTEQLRVVNVRQMIGQVVMEYGGECVRRDVSVRQSYERFPTEKAYVDAQLLPECLRYAMGISLRLCGDSTTITIRAIITEAHSLDFLVINFNVTGPSGFPQEFVDALEKPLAGYVDSDDDDDDGSGDNGEGDEGGILGSSVHQGHGAAGHPSKEQRRERRRSILHLSRVRIAVEQQGGTLRVQRNAEDSNMIVLIPYVPAEDSDADAEFGVGDTSGEDSMMHGRASRAISDGAHTTTSVARHQAHLGAGSEMLSLSSLMEPQPGTTTTRTTASAGATAVSLTSVEASPHLGSSQRQRQQQRQQGYTFTTLIAEDTGAHRNMLCSFLWERKHAVLPAYSLEDIDRLAGVGDILLIDVEQSIMSSLSSNNPIALLQELSRHMAIIVTSRHFDVVKADVYEAAGFITLKKPSTAMQATRAIRKAEDKVTVFKEEAERIAQARETLAKNSRGAWERGRMLGKGTFGEVFEAIDVLTGGTMAMKEMRLSGGNVQVEQFVQEIAAMCSLQHPNIIHYFYCEESMVAEMKVFRVFMEFAPGGTLQTWLKQQEKVSFKEFQSKLCDITEGLAYIHSQNYVHCDIKPTNVLLGHDGKAKIGDFGTARLLDEGQLLYEMQGSPLYMSPECMSAGEVDPESGLSIGYSFPSDVWSLGCVALEMITGKQPFSHIKKFNGPAGFTHYITSLTDTPDLSVLFEEPPSVIEFVSACLNPDPASRATASQLLQFSIFQEATDECTISAVAALKRAKLLHVLNKFVAFQDPPEAAESSAAPAGAGPVHIPSRMRGFFDTSSSSSASTSDSSSLFLVSANDKASRDALAGHTDLSRNENSFTLISPKPAHVECGAHSSSSSSDSTSGGGSPTCDATGADQRAKPPHTPTWSKHRAGMEEDQSPTPRKRSKTAVRDDNDEVKDGGVAQAKIDSSASFPGDAVTGVVDIARQKAAALWMKVKQRHKSLATSSLGVHPNASFTNASFSRITMGSHSTSLEDAVRSAANQFLGSLLAPPRGVNSETSVCEPGSGSSENKTDEENHRDADGEGGALASAVTATSRGSSPAPASPSAAARSHSLVPAAASNGNLVILDVEQPRKARSRLRSHFGKSLFQVEEKKASAMSQLLPPRGATESSSASQLFSSIPFISQGACEDQSTAASTGFFGNAGPRRAAVVPPASRGESCDPAAVPQTISGNIVAAANVPSNSGASPPTTSPERHLAQIETLLVEIAAHVQAALTDAASAPQQNHHGLEVRSLGRPNPLSNPAADIGASAPDASPSPAPGATTSSGRAIGLPPPAALHSWNLLTNPSSVTRQPPPVAGSFHNPTGNWLCQVDAKSGPAANLLEQARTKLQILLQYVEQMKQQERHQGEKIKEADGNPPALSTPTRSVER